MLFYTVLPLSNSAQKGLLHGDCSELMSAASKLDKR